MTAFRTVLVIAVASFAAAATTAMVEINLDSAYPSFTNTLTVKSDKTMFDYSLYLSRGEHPADISFALIDRDADKSVDLPFKQFELYLQIIAHTQGRSCQRHDEVHRCAATPND